MEENKRKYFSMLGLITISMFIIGASYAYFTVSTTNNFGTHTISGTMEDVGSVALTSTGNNISLNLSASDMMQGDSDITYYGTTDGTPTTQPNLIKLADAVTTGTGYYNCNYTMQITASGTNNMYTAFQGMSGKSAGQIMLSINDGNNSNQYDFNTANLFPITINGSLNGVAAGANQSLFGLFTVINKRNVNQTALAGTDITMTATVTSFTCNAVTPPYTYWNTTLDNNRYPNNVTLLANSKYEYIRTSTSDNSNALCIYGNNTEVCVKANDWANRSVYSDAVIAAGGSCPNNDGSRLNCVLGTASFNFADMGWVEGSRCQIRVFGTVQVPSCS